MSTKVGSECSYCGKKQPFRSCCISMSKPHHSVQHSVDQSALDMCQIDEFPQKQSHNISVDKSESEEEEVMVKTSNEIFPAYQEKINPNDLKRMYLKLDRVY